MDSRLKHRQHNAFSDWGMAMLPVALVGLLVATFSGGCNTQGCTDNQSALPLMGFYSMSTKEQIALDSLEMGGVGAPSDSMLFRKGSSRQWVYLPFRFASGESRFFFHYAYPGIDDPANNDTVVLCYSAEPYFASEECGAYYRYKLKSVGYTTHLIDSIGVSDSLITNIEMERIQVYFRTVEPDEPTGDDSTSGDAEEPVGEGGGSEQAGSDGNVSEGRVAL